MKVKYTSAVIQLITLATELNKELKNDRYCSDQWAKELPEGFRSFVYDQCLTDESNERKSEIAKMLPYGCYISRHVTTHEDHWNITFSADPKFKSRAEMMEWAKANKIKIPKDCQKDGEIIDGKIHTRVTHMIKLSDELKLRVSYLREGAPTAHCRIESSVYSTVVCDLH
jgi:hypothetical protein